MERCFIRELVRKFESGSCKAGQPSDEAIRSAVAAVNVVFGTKLNFNIGQARLNHLKERHQTFNWLINRPGVRWIARPNIVLVNESLWEDIAREMPSALAYRFDTEPAWDELKIISAFLKMSHSTPVTTRCTLKIRISKTKLKFDCLQGEMTILKESQQSTSLRSSQINLRWTMTT
ncbi:hypothetical protein Salat_1437500 [Sesamum alatum]|uniref:Uncharacterized protein n=1 Tax=Sesamum alatum TaxID=300844 RepID=A0AAE1YBR2_9LAMI|nr:hypothetical protein Salat_1437500 [Sesamum alatum]